MGGADLGKRLNSLCFELEAQGGGRGVSNLGGFQSKDLTWRTEAALKELMGMLHEPLVLFLRQSGQASPPAALSSDPDLRVAAVMTDLWANVNRPGDRNIIHNHGEPTASVVASGVYYPGVGGPEAGGVCGGAKLRLFVPSGVVELPPEPGSLLLFPTNLLHETQPVPAGDGARVSLAFNLRVRWLDRPLLRAAAEGDLRKVKQLVAQGAAIDEGDAVLGLQPLHLAAEGGHLTTVKFLKELGADANVLSSEGSSPLGLAFDRGHQEVERFLGGPREAVRAQLARSGLPPVRPASPAFPGVPVDRPDVMAAFEAAGLPPPAGAGGELQPLLLAALGALALVAVAAVAALGVLRAASHS